MFHHRFSVRGSRGTSPGPRGRYKPGLEPLEDRFFPSVTVVAEAEPNNSDAQAPNLLVVNGTVLVNGAIQAAGDMDYFKFTTTVNNQRLWAYVDTGGTQTGGATSRDSVLELLDGDGSTILEADHNDGTGNGGDGTADGDLNPVEDDGLRASVIANHLLPTAGTYYLRVRESVNNQVLNPYKLYVRVTGLPAFSGESEPNDSAAAANAVADLEGFPVRVGEIHTGADDDWFAFQARAGDTVFVAVDGDPDRNGTGPDLQLQLLRPGFFVPQTLLTADSAPSSSAANPAGEAFSWDVTTTGTYYVRVAGVGGTTGNYHLLVAGNSHPGSLQFGATTFVGSEAGGNVSVTVQRVGGAEGVVTVNYAVTGGSATAGGDYTPVGGTLTFANGETSKTVFIPVHADVFQEGNETITLALSQPGGGAVLGTRPTTVATIQDSGLPPLTDVTPRVSVHRGKVKFRRGRRRFRQQVLLRNDGGEVLYGPLMLVLDGSNFTLRGASGFTRNQGPLGSPYLVVTNGVLNPGQGLLVGLDLVAKKGRPTFLTRVLTGSGAP